MSSTILSPSAPRNRSGFQVAIFCALPLEAENVYSVFDKCWEDQDKKYGKAPGDQNSYNTGVIGNYNVVLVHMPSMGINSAALAAAGLRSSFRGIQLALVVGICGVVPIHPVTEQEIVLGDIVISTAVVQYDFGRQHPGGFARKKEVGDSLSRANPEIRAFINMLAVRQNRQRFNDKLGHLVQSEEFQAKSDAAVYPGAVHDRLYQASYLHKHRSDVTCDKCLVDSEFCFRSCDELDCEDEQLVSRERHKLEKGQLPQGIDHTPLMHLGRFGSANTVMRSGLDRDRLSSTDELTAFEMEGAGVWEQYPTIIIKAACDYADGHKNKTWQKYAAGIAAGGLKVLLDECFISEPLIDRGGPSEPIWHVPFDRMPGFVGRKNELRCLEQKVLEPQGPRTVALLGLGGVGKSRLALELAFRLRSQLPDHSILWVQATEQSTFENSIREIGIKLRIPGIEDKKTDVKTLVKQRLSNSDHQWVLILDNADDITLWCKPTDSGSTETSLMEYLPRTTTGSILITTRSEQVAHFLAETHVIKLPTLPRDEAIKMFIVRLQNADLAADRDTLSTLLDQLAYIPLAIVQAASYINKAERPIQVYVDLMAKSEKYILKLLSQDFGDRSRYHDAINPVATTWLISFKHIQKHHPLAATLLSRMACLHEKRIPQSLLLDDSLGFDEIDLINAIAVLTGYSFTTKQAVMGNSLADIGEFYDMHRLVRIAARNWLKQEGTMSDHVKSSTIRLAQLFPTRNHEHKSIWTMYLPHAQRLCEEVVGENLPERYELLEKMGLCFVIDGNYEEAIEAHTMVVKWREKNFGVCDERTYNAYGALGEALLLKGEWSRAEKYLQQAFEWQKEWLGQDKPATLNSMADLASIYWNQGRWTQAEELEVQVMETRKRVLGEEHPLTLTSIANLASTYWNQGRWTQAEELQVQVMEMEKRVLGEEHPDTLTSIANLASMYRNQGRWTQAEELQVQVMEMRKRVLGEEHPSTLTSIGNLASTYWNQGRWTQAEELQVQVMEMRKRVLGEEHPSTLTSIANLASTYWKQGRWTQAEELQVQVMETSRRVLGEEHPDTLTSIGNLASTYRNQGRWTQAEELQVQVMEMEKRVLGEEHPSTLTSIANLALTYWNQGRWRQAEELEVQVMETRKRVLGEEHPDTLNTMFNLAWTLKAQNKAEQAVHLMQICVGRLTNVLGSEHTHTQSSLSALKDWRGIKDFTTHQEEDDMRQVPGSWID